MQTIEEASCWDMTSIKAEVAQQTAGMTADQVRQAYCELLAAVAPFRIVLSSLTNNPRLSRYSSHHPYSDLFPYRSDDNAQSSDEVWVRPLSEKRWIPEHDALRDGLEYERGEGIELVDAPLRLSAIVLGIAGSEDCCAVMGGEIRLADVERLEAAGRLALGQAQRAAQDGGGDRG